MKEILSGGLPSSLHPGVPRTFLSWLEDPFGAAPVPQLPSCCPGMESDLGSSSARLSETLRGLTSHQEGLKGCKWGHSASPVEVSCLSLGADPGPRSHCNPLSQGTQHLTLQECGQESHLASMHPKMQRLSSESARPLGDTPSPHHGASSSGKAEAT